ncbi:MAG TPA: CAP domain-containing protein [Acidimicrobiia bacterium]|nr:CAP domain-containing protein [Acidimicrobiia bacterium]
MRRTLALTTVTAAWVIVIQLLSGAMAPPRFIDLAAADVVPVHASPSTPSPAELVKAPVLFSNPRVAPATVSLPSPSPAFPVATTTPLAVTTTTGVPVTTAASAPATTLAPPTTAAPTTMAAPTTTAAPATTAAPTTTAALPAAGSFSSSAEADFLLRINNLRSSVGVSGLAGDASLNNYARWWAKHMAETGDFAHSNIGSLLGTWSIVGENIGYGAAVGPVFTALVNSPSHYNNMVEARFAAVGVGVYVDATGYLWTAHVFGG